MVIAFLDASALIYLLESAEPFRSRVRQSMGELLVEDPHLRLAVSRLTWLEVRVGPMKSHATGLLKVYDDFFARPDLIWQDLTQDVVELATVMRVRHGLRTPDALQAASCLQLGTQHRFLTGDKRFQGVSGLRVIYLNE